MLDSSLQVDLQGGVQHVHLGQHTGQVANHRANVRLELVVVLEELLKLCSLVDLQDSLLSLPLASPVEEVSPKVGPLVRVAVAASVEKLGEGAPSAVNRLRDVHPWVAGIAGQGGEGVVGRGGQGAEL